MVKTILTANSTHNYMSSRPLLLDVFVTYVFPVKQSQKLTFNIYDHLKVVSTYSTLKVIGQVSSSLISYVLEVMIRSPVTTRRCLLVN
jgi:hypothetical protein